MVLNLGLASAIIGAIVLAPSRVLAGQTTYQGSCLGVVETVGSEPTATSDCDRVVVVDLPPKGKSIEFRFVSPKGQELRFITDRSHMKVGKGRMFKLQSFSVDVDGVASKIPVTGFCEIGVSGNNVGCTAYLNDTKMRIVLTPNLPATAKVYRSLEEAAWGEP